MNSLLAVDGATAQDRLILRKTRQAPSVDGILSPGEYDDGVRLDNSFIQLTSWANAALRASVYVTRDAEKLYLAYRVHERDPLRNGGADWRTLFATRSVERARSSPPKIRNDKRGVANRESSPQPPVE